ncbi:Glycosyltransferase Gtf1 [Candidatus Bilamarchaeum dharawalense]|uniref:Glycosyltransferase Gtf1 n=1 Tax=Candidatus Bilamarchaeum dharawalense TaxID=2885759 RepID=A0A5E4LR84_9ARCH|nr:Glycosyltransferase Gtf1 [Candidatus Bilamarchaeum dharawalense]
MSDTLMLLSGGHPVHRAFGEAIGADFFQPSQLATKSQFAPFKALNLVKIALSIPTGYKYILCESAYFYPALKHRLGLLGKSKIININCGPVLYHVLSGRIKGIEAQLLTSLLHEVDGHLVYGSFGKEILSKFGVKTPVYVVYPFVSSDSFKKLVKIKPALNSHRICIIATADAYNKGLDILFSAVSKVKEIYPDVSIDIITRMEEKEIHNLNKTNYPVRIFKNITDVSRILSGTALYVQPSRSDMFPISVIEAMACGIPTIVSTETGTKEVVGKICSSMVVKCDGKELSEAILSYFALSTKEKKSLSTHFRDASLFFEEKNMLKIFKNQFSLLKKEIQ